MAIVVDVACAPQRLVLRDFVHGRERVLVQSQGILSEGLHTHGQRAVARGDRRKPRTRQQRRPRRVRPVGSRHRLGARGLGRGSLGAGIANFQRRIGQAVHAQDVAVGFDRRQQHFARDRAADFLHSGRRPGPARKTPVSAAPGPDVVDVPVVADEKDFVGGFAEARRMLHRPVAQQHGGSSFGDFDQRPAFVAQTGHDYPVASRRDGVPSLPTRTTSASPLTTRTAAIAPSPSGAAKRKRPHRVSRSTPPPASSRYRS